MSNGPWSQPHAPFACSGGTAGLARGRVDNPFRVLEAEVERLRSATPVIVVDFHAETTSEKTAMARMLDEPWEPAVRNPTDDQILDVVSRLGQTLYHPTSTCAMGTVEGSVVDPELKVHGVEGLRVADASVMPRVPRGNTNAPTIMIGEKVADLIRGA